MQNIALQYCSDPHAETPTQTTDNEKTFDSIYNGKL